MSVQTAGTEEWRQDALTDLLMNINHDPISVRLLVTVPGQVLLASCYEEWQLDAVRGHLDKGLSLTVDPTGSVNASPLEASSGAGRDHCIIFCRRAFGASLNANCRQLQHCSSSSPHSESLSKPAVPQTNMTCAAACRRGQGRPTQGLPRPTGPPANLKAQGQLAVGAR